MKKVSVIIACYNCEKYIDDCMTTLLRQTIGFDNLEVILVNDASTDRTIFKLAEYEHQYPNNIILIPLTENMRQGGARNAALPYAGGEYVLFLDSDDYLSDVALEHLYQAAIGNRADIVQCKAEHTKEHVYQEWKIETDESDELFTFSTIEERKRFIMSDKPILGCCFKLYRNDFLQEHQFLFAEHIAFEEPPFVSPMLFYAERIFYLNELLYMVYLNPMGTMRAQCLAEERKRDYLISAMQELAELQMRGLLADYAEEIEFRFLHSYFAMGLLVLKSRGFFVDVGLLREMQQTVKQLFPNYAENGYLKEPDRVIARSLSNCVELEVDETGIESFNEQLTGALKTMLDNQWLV